jgi:hypothetical protein
VIEAAACSQLEAARRGLEYRGGEVGIVYNLGNRVAERIERMRLALTARPNHGQPVHAGNGDGRETSRIAC